MYDDGSPAVLTEIVKATGSTVRSISFNAIYSGSLYSQSST